MVSQQFLYHEESCKSAIKEDLLGLGCFFRNGTRDKHTQPFLDESLFVFPNRGHPPSILGAKSGNPTIVLFFRRSPETKKELENGSKIVPIKHILDMMMLMAQTRSRQFKFEMNHLPLFLDDPVDSKDILFE
jgi:hypothetical protein